MSQLPPAMATALPWLLPATVLGAFAATAALTGPLTRWLASHQFGKAIRLDGPEHQSKQGTPTMGGLVMLGVLCAAGLPLLAGRDRPAAALLLLSMLAFAALGLLDDIAGLARRSGRKELGVGLKARSMFVLQLLAASLLTLSILRLASPQAGLEQAINDLPLAALMVLAILGTVNGVNLSDGLDGLATGLLAIAFAALLAMGLSGASAVLAGVALGACLGFLVHNRHPAKVFMGNVASMGLGALLATVALLGGKLLLLPVVGAVFVAEVLSDLIQVGWFKWTRRRTGTGRRVFRMAPIHHHFEALGWPETLVVRRFWQAGALFAFFAWMLSRWLV
jgi:phospho-N-acetylmuramoyl-pentapeptide-transferase